MTEKYDESVLIFTATYCEAGNIGEWYRRVRATLPTADILVIDDNSPDGTGQRLRSLAQQDQRFCYIVRSGKLGLGSAHRLAMAYALQNDYALLATLDADLSHQPEQLFDLIRATQHSDFVIGTRFGEGTSSYTGFRRLTSEGANWLARLLIPTGLTEYTSSMRAFNRQALQVLTEKPVKDDGYAFFMEVVYRLQVAGLTLREVPINFVDRWHGKSKIPKDQILVSALVLLRLTIDRKVSQRRGNSGK